MPLSLSWRSGEAGVLVAVVGLVVESFCLGEAGEMEALKYIRVSMVILDFPGGSDSKAPV